MSLESPRFPICSWSGKSDSEIGAVSESLEKQVEVRKIVADLRCVREQPALGYVMLMTLLRAQVLIEPNSFVASTFSFRLKAAGHC